MDYVESPVTRGYRRFFDVYRVDIDRIPKFDQFVLALREALTACHESANKLVGETSDPGGAPDIKGERTRKGISIKALARKAGVSVLTLRHIERGKAKPQKATLKKIVDALRDAEPPAP